jgi:hypothetical protein
MQKPKRKLKVQRETVRLLEEKQLAQAVGGESDYEHCPTTVPRGGLKTLPA